MTTEFAVEMVEVVKRFPTPEGGIVTAVDHVSLQIKDGEFFSLLGPSGCGKTTTLRMIAGFELPTEGNILIRGKEMGYVPPFKRPVNTVFQHYALFPHMNVEQNVGFGLEMRGFTAQDRENRIAEVLELVQLKGMGKRKPKQLSGGQQQRVALARALINNPEVLLLDEPLGALDLKLRKAMQLELKAIQERVGITFIYVTHDQEEALTMSDRIGVMSQGRLLQVGNAQDIYEDPQTRFVADFIGETNYIDGKVVGQDGLFVEVALDEGGKVWALTSVGVEMNEKVHVAVRPEKIALLRNGDETPPNAPRGTIVDLVYIGSDTIYIVRLPNGSDIRARNQNTNVFRNSQIEKGTQVALSWPKDSSKAFSPRYD